MEIFNWQQIQPMGFIDADLKIFLVFFFFRHWLISMHESDIKTDKFFCILHRGKFCLVSCAAKINRLHSIDCDKVFPFVSRNLKNQYFQKKWFLSHGDVRTCLILILKINACRLEQ